MCFSQNGRSPIGRHVATSEAASSFTLSDTNPLSHHRSRPHKTTNAVPLNQAHTNAPSPEPLASFCTTHHALYPTQPHTPHWAHGLSQTNKGAKPWGHSGGVWQHRSLSSAQPGIDPQRPACPIGLAVRGVEPRQGRPDNNEYIKSNTKNILSILTHALFSFLVNWTAYNKHNKVVKLPKITTHRGANRCWCFKVSCHVYSGLFLTLLTG